MENPTTMQKFLDYVDSLNLVVRSSEQDDNGFSALVNKSNNLPLKKFTTMTNHSTYLMKVRLSFADVHNKDITGNFFEK